MDPAPASVVQLADLLLVRAVPPQEWVALVPEAAVELDRVAAACKDPDHLELAVPQALAVVRFGLRVPAVRTADEPASRRTRM